MPMSISQRVSKLEKLAISISKILNNMEKQMKELSVNKTKPKNNDIKNNDIKNILKQINKSKSKKDLQKFTIKELLCYCSENDIKPKKKVKKIIVEQVYDDMFESDSSDDSDSSYSSDSESSYSSDSD